MKKKKFFYLIVVALMLCGCSMLRQAEPKQSILDKKVSLDEAGVLWQVPNERVESGTGQKIFLFEDNLLLFGAAMNDEKAYKSKLTMVSCETGEVLKEKDYSDFLAPSIDVCGDMIAISDWESGTVQFLDKNLEVTSEYRCTAASGPIYVSGNGKKLYIFTVDDGIHIIDVKTKTEKVLLQGEAVRLYPSVKCGDSVSLSYTDASTQMSENAVIDLSTSLIETIPFEGAFYAVTKSDGVWLAQSYDQEDIFYIGKKGYIKTFTLESDYGVASMITEPSRILATDYGKNGLTSMKLYDAGGAFLSACDLDIKKATLAADPVWSEKDGGYYFIVTAEPGKDILLFWDVSVPVTGEALLFDSVKGEEPKGAVSAHLYEKAEEISRKYGVSVLIAEQGRINDKSWSIERIYDSNLIEDALMQLESALATYPDGFMEQLRYGTQDEIEFLLSGSVKSTEVPETSVGFTYYIGFASELEGKNAVVIDITAPGSLKQTIYHEIMHLIDYKLQFDAKIRKDALYSEEKWMKLNPEGFSYPNRKYDLPFDIYKEGYENYFIDIYSRTTSNEDRARIMEYAMIGNDWIFSSSPARQAKLEYLSDCIRDAFDTTDWGKMTLWEQTLNRLPK